MAYQLSLLMLNLNEIELARFISQIGCDYLPSSDNLNTNKWLKVIHTKLESVCT